MKRNVKSYSDFNLGDTVRLNALGIYEDHLNNVYDMMTGKIIYILKTDNDCYITYEDPYFKTTRKLSVCLLEKGIIDDEFLKRLDSISQMIIPMQKIKTNH